VLPAIEAGGRAFIRKLFTVQDLSKGSNLRLPKRWKWPRRTGLFRGYSWGIQRGAGRDTFLQKYH